MKKILVVDDSALMRRVLCDIIDNDERFQVADRAANGQEALELLTKKKYDAVVLDVNMPVMDGLSLLKELQKRRIPAKVMMASTDTKEGAKTTLDALELGALDFVHKPVNALNCREEIFKNRMLDTLEAVACGHPPVFGKAFTLEEIQTSKKIVEMVQKHASQIAGNRLVAIASSTGGPKALQSVIPRLPKNLKAPVLIVQHMPAGFTASFAERLNNLSELEVKEAAEGDVLQNGHVYLARGGAHMKVQTRNGKCTIIYTNEPPREGVRPCANYMYESLVDAPFDEVVCVVMTGMGADGTKGIQNLAATKKVHIIAQEQSTCAVYGMPKSIVATGMVNQVVPLEQIAQEIILNVGVK